MTTLHLLLLAPAFFVAGIIGTVAGGAAFLTFPALLIAGLDPRTANITSTLALFPCQFSAGFLGRREATDIQQVSFTELLLASVVGGMAGAGLLLVSPPTFFAQLVPWLILFATVAFALGTMKVSPLPSTPTLGHKGLLLTQLLISVYGGYFGGGISFLMLASLSLGGIKLRTANAIKNILAATMNGAAVLLFVFSHSIDWTDVFVGATFSICGGVVGIRLIHRINERHMRWLIIVIGVVLTIVLFNRTPTHPT